MGKGSRNNQAANRPEGLSRVPELRLGKSGLNLPGPIPESGAYGMDSGAGPYRAFLHPELEVGVWEPTKFMDIAHVAFLLLEACGDATIGQYRDSETHSLFGLANWRPRVRTECRGCPSTQHE